MDDLKVSVTLIIELGECQKLSALLRKKRLEVANAHNKWLKALNHWQGEYFAHCLILHFILRSKVIFSRGRPFQSLSNLMLGTPPSIELLKQIWYSTVNHSDRAKRQRFFQEILRIYNYSFFGLDAQSHSQFVESIFCDKQVLCDIIQSTLHHSYESTILLMILSLCLRPTFSI